MTTYAMTNRLDHLSSKENRSVSYGIATVSAALAIGDKVRCGRIAGGTKVDRVVVKTGDMETDATPTLTDKIGYEPIDGSAGDDDAFCASGATTRQAAATTTYEIFPPVLVAKDSWVTITCVAAATAMSAAVTAEAKVEGEYVGIK